MNNQNRFLAESRAQGGQVKSVSIKLIFDQQSGNHLLQKSTVIFFIGGDWRSL